MLIVIIARFKMNTFFSKKKTLKNPCITEIFFAFEENRHPLNKNNNKKKLIKRWVHIAIAIS
jgi:hypothetical protein